MAIVEEYAYSTATWDGVVPPVVTGKMAWSGGFVLTPMTDEGVDSLPDESTQLTR